MRTIRLAIAVFFLALSVFLIGMFAGVLHVAGAE